MKRLIICAVMSAFVAMPQERLAAQVAAAPPGAVPSVSDAVGVIRIVNRSGTARQIELRAAVRGGCAAGPNVSRQSIAAGATFVIRSSQPLCIRRSVAGVLNAQMTGTWEHKPMRRGVLAEVVL